MPSMRLVAPDMALLASGAADADDGVGPAGRGGGGARAAAASGVGGGGVGGDGGGGICGRDGDPRDGGVGNRSKISRRSMKKPPVKAWQRHLGSWIKCARVGY